MSAFDSVNLFNHRHLIFRKIFQKIVSKNTVSIGLTLIKIYQICKHLHNLQMSRRTLNLHFIQYLFTLFNYLGCRYDIQTL